MLLLVSLFPFLRENLLMIRNLSLAALAICLIAASVVSPTYLQAQEGKWVSLFDGKSLDGWEKIGDEKSKWEVKDGAVLVKKAETK